MPAPLPRPRRLGVLVPSSNTVLEPESAKLMPADGSVTMHVSRLEVLRIAADEAASDQFAPERFIAAARLLAHAEVDLLLWNGTAASWLGFDKDEALAKALQAATGIPATTSVLAINHELARLGAKTIGLVTPYVAEIEAAIIANYVGAGLPVVAASRLDLTVNAAFGAVPAERIAELVRHVARAEPDAIVIMCTNLAGSSVAAPLSRELGRPVLDSVRTSVLHSLDVLAGLPA